MATRTNGIDRHVGQRVRLRRKMLRLTQTDLASAIGLTFQQVQKYEKGTNRIGSGRLYQLALVLKVPVSFFFEDLPTELASLPGDETASTESATFTREPGVALAGGCREALAMAHAFQGIDNLRLRRRIIALVAELAVESPAA